MAADEIHIGDCTEFRATVYDGTSTVDISSATTTATRFFTFKKPDGTLSTQSASLFGTGSTGSCAFTATTLFLDTAGEWQAQLTLILSSGTFHSDVYKFTVYSNL
jgi:hypothetical protein